MNDSNNPFPGEFHRATESEEANASLEGNIPAVKRFISSKVSEKQDVDDLVQDTLLRTLKQSETSHLKNPIAYMVSVAKTVVYDYWKSQKQQEKKPLEDVAESADVISVEQQISHRQQVQRLSESLQKMPTLRRQVFVMRRLEGKSREEIATALGISAAAVKKHINRAMLDLHEADK